MTDTRIVETIQRMQESLLGKSDNTVPLKVIVECDEAIEIPACKAPRGETDPLMVELQTRLESLVKKLSSEARLASEVGLS